LKNLVSSSQLSGAFQILYDGIGPVISSPALRKRALGNRVGAFPLAAYFSPVVSDVPDLPSSLFLAGPPSRVIPARYRADEFSLR